MNASPLVIASSDLALRAELVPWDTESFGVRVAQVSELTVGDFDEALRQSLRLREWLDDERFSLASCRLPSSRLRESRLLEGRGFCFVEMVYGMELDLSGTQREPAELSPSWRRASAADLPELQPVAAAAFVTGRFNVDERIGPDLGGRRYADWVSRSIDHPTQEVWVAEVADQLAGFFIVESRADGSVYWHLTAVSPQCQGRGVGTAMWSSMANRHRAQGATSIATTISARNIPVLNLYARLGWRFRDCSMTFHWTRDTTSVLAGVGG